VSGALRRYLLPGFVYTGVVIGGGYATGRDLVQFFLTHNPAGALLGLFTAALCWGLLLAIVFEFARVTGSYDYRSFFRALLGRAWWLFEVPFLTMLAIGLSVIAAAAGEIVNGLTGLPSPAGMLLLLAAVGLLVTTGTRMLERVLGWGSMLLYLFYVLFLWRCWTGFGDDMLQAVADHAAQPAAALGGVQYVVLNLSMVVAVMFCLRDLTTRREALGAGLFGGLLAALPAFLFTLSMGAFYPQILAAPVPVSYMLDRMGSAEFALAFQLLLFFTLIQTGAGLLHAVNERVAATLAESGRVMPRSARAGLALGYVVVSAYLAATFGIIELVAKGYTAMAMAFVLTVALPLLTIGVWKITRTA
jgi:uncharacterized membrane protein YkvI